MGEKSENGLSNKDVTTKYGVPRNTVSTWAKNKHKKGINFSRKIHVVGTTKR